MWCGPRRLGFRVHDLSVQSFWLGVSASCNSGQTDLPPCLLPCSLTHSLTQFVFLLCLSLSLSVSRSLSPSPFPLFLCLSSCHPPKVFGGKIGGLSSAARGYARNPSYCHLVENSPVLVSGIIPGRGHPVHQIRTGPGCTAGASTIAYHILAHILLLIAMGHSIIM